MTALLRGLDAPAMGDEDDLPRRSRTGNTAGAPTLPAQFEPARARVRTASRPRLRRSSLRKLIAPLVIAGLLGPAVAPAVAGAAINVGDNYFVRTSGVPTVTVAKGAKVKWKWIGQERPQRERDEGPGDVPVADQVVRHASRRRSRRRARTR